MVKKNNRPRLRWVGVKPMQYSLQSNLHVCIIDVHSFYLQKNRKKLKKQYSSTWTRGYFLSSNRREGHEHTKAFFPRQLFRLASLASLLEREREPINSHFPFSSAQSLVHRSSPFSPALISYPFFFRLSSLTLSFYPEGPDHIRSGDFESQGSRIRWSRVRSESG